MALLIALPKFALVCFRLLLNARLGLNGCMEGWDWMEIHCRSQPPIAEGEHVGRTKKRQGGSGRMLAAVASGLY